MLNWIENLLGRGEDEQQPRTEELLDESLCAAAAANDPSALPAEIPAHRDAEGNTLLHLAAKAGADACVAHLLPSHDPKAVNEDGCTPLHLACFDNRESTVELLLADERMRVEVDARTGDSELTALHVAAAKGFAGIAVKLIGAGAEACVQDAGGQSPLHMAACNGFDWLLGPLLHAGADQAARTAKLATPLYLAARNGKTRCVKTLLDALLSGGDDARATEVLNLGDLSGYTALCAACLTSNVDAALMLIEAGSDVNHAARDGSTPLLCCRSSQAAPIVRLLLDEDADPSAVTVFGSTVLHHACEAAAYSLVDSLLASEGDGRSALLAAQDNDGMFAMHSLAQAASKAEDDDGELPNGNIQACFRTLASVSDVGCLDYGDSSALHYLAFGPYSATALWLAQALIDAGVDPTRENCQGWTPLHCCNTRASESGPMLELLKAAVSPEFLSTFDIDKPRDVHNETYLARRGAHNRIPLEERADVLRGDFSLQGIAAHLGRLPSARPPQVVVLAGAGMSVSAGIPDFRSAGSGIFMNKTYEDAFDISKPDRFFRCVHDLFLPVVDGTVVPTPTHRFLKQLQDRGMLRRLYTQNIDMLEFRAGLHDDKVMEAHGSFRTATCMGCEARVAKEDMEAQFWAVVRNGGAIPRCGACQGVLRPDVIFFGEGLPQRFHELRDEDMRSADLLIVLGTSLVVYPVAGLVNQVRPLVPRLLINRKPTGPFQGLDRERTADEAETGHFRDVFYEGECDAGVEELGRLLGW